MPVVLPGLLLSVGLAGTAWVLGQTLGGPTLAYALLLGIPLHHLASRPTTRPGIEFSARQILRLGVALLGLRITLGEVLEMGWAPVVVVLCVVPVTLLAGWLLAPRLGLSRQFGVLSGGATAICGVSAAMAISSVLPRRAESEKWLIMAVIGVTTLSTVAMLVYPWLCELLGLDAMAAGYFLGGSIHDVAQVVGAGYLLGEQAGGTATFTKLLRVGMLLPVVMAVSWWTARRASLPSADRPPLLPGFLLAFLVLVVVNSLGWVPEALRSALIELSSACLLVSIAAIGVKTALRELMSLGWQPIVLMGLEAGVIAGVALGLVLLVA